MLQFSRRGPRSIAALSLGLLTVLAASARAQDGLTPFKNHFVTGDYVAAASR